MGLCYVRVWKLPQHGLVCINGGLVHSSILGLLTDSKMLYLELADIG